MNQIHIFLQKFFTKVKTQISPGFEDRSFTGDLNISNFLRQAKDFYTAKGTEYVGQKIRACGVFRYLVPKEGDDFTANPEGNKSYGYFCEAIGIKLPTVEKEINGETVKVKSLPTIKADDIIGMPVVGVVGKGRPYTNKNGKEVTPSEVKFVKAWSDGIKKEMNADADIPF